MSILRRVVAFLRDVLSGSAEVGDGISARTEAQRHPREQLRGRTFDGNDGGNS